MVVYWLPLLLYKIAPPEMFDPKMKWSKFQLFLNANGISYEVCKMLKGERLIYKFIGNAIDDLLCMSLSGCCPWKFECILHYVSNLIPGCKITAGDFNLRSYELWSQKVQLSWKDESALKNLIGKLSKSVHTQCS